MNPICMAAYFWMDSNSVASILRAQPKYIIANSPAGPWKSNADIRTFKNAGIKYFEYLDGGYESTIYGGIPNDLASNLAFIQAAAGAGAFGIFLDQVSDGIYRTPNYDYLGQIAARAGVSGKTGIIVGMIIAASLLLGNMKDA
jgi:hypothetical protein